MTHELGPAVLLVVLTLLDIGALAALRAALVAKRVAQTGTDDLARPNVIPLSDRLPDARRAATPPSRAA